MDEFARWVPSIPVVMYHGKPEERAGIFQKEIMRNMKGGRPTDKFPVVCTTYEMVLKDRSLLSRINWEFIIIVSHPRPARCYAVSQDDRTKDIG